MVTDKIDRLIELSHMAYVDADHAYDIVIEPHDNVRYQLSLGFLNLSYVSYSELKRFYFDNQDIHEYEINLFMKNYEKFIFELKEVIIKEDQNTSWLYSTHTSLTDSWKEMKEHLERTNKGTY